MIKKITIEAVSLKKTKKDGSPYMWNDKKAGKMSPRTMVSVKELGGEWYMGWSYKDGSAAEQLAQGQVVEVLLTEDTKTNPDGTVTTFKNWKFPKQEDKDAQTIADLQAKLSSLANNPLAKTGDATAPDSNPSALNQPPF